MLTGLPVVEDTREEAHETEDMVLNHILVALLLRLGGEVTITPEEHRALHSDQGGVIDIGVDENSGEVQVKLVPTKGRSH